MDKIKKEKREKRGLLLLLLLLLIFITGVALFFFLKTDNLKTNDGGSNPQNSSPSDSLVKLNLIKLAVADSLKNRSDSLKKLDSTKITDSLKKTRLDSLEIVTEDSIKKIVVVATKLKADTLKTKKAKVDTLTRSLNDTVKNDTVKTADSLTPLTKPCADTTAPWIYPEPSGGLHYGEVLVKFVSTKECEIFYSFDTTKGFTTYTKNRITIKKSSTLFYKAVDSCGNSFNISSKKYTIKLVRAKICPNGMEQIEGEKNSFCIDKYEWPNKKGVKPYSNVTFAQASDSCFTAGKRLCTASEWESACSGVYNWRYPYGEKYSQQACVTQEKKSRKSGDAGECRSWNAVYDLVGNLAEWTSTKAPKKDKFYLVKGGFWESGSRGSCKSSRYSYYPQNHHNPVGFRCCKDSDL